MGRRRRPPQPDPDDPAAAVAQICADPGIVWFGIKHYSPACAVHVARAIEHHAPAAVLIEGPDDANELIPWLTHPQTRPPITLLSSWVDRRNKLGKNGVLSPSDDVPARYRGWWPLVGFGPELAAARAGAAVGAQVAFIDASLKAQLPTMHRSQRQASDRALAESAYVEALAARTGHPGFEAWWQATFEAGATTIPTEDFRRAVLTFAWCARHVSAAAEDPSTTLREAHMRWWVDRIRREHPAGTIVVVTGAYHAVALPFLAGRRAPGRPDRDTNTLLCAHSFRSLARLTSGEGITIWPGFAAAVFEAAAGGQERPHDAAAMKILALAAQEARARGAAVGTADVVGALEVARGLAGLRGSASITPADVLDAVTTAFVKGQLDTDGAPILAAARAAMVGHALGQVAEGAGRPPLLEDFYEEARRHRLDLSGEQRVVRCDVHKQPAHRRKSAFLHAARILQLPLFGELPDTGEPYRGPDLATGTRLDLTSETWAVCWTEDVDDRLVELSDRGVTVADAAQVELLGALREAGTDVARVARCTLGIAQVRATALLPDALDALCRAAAADAALPHLVEALEGVVMLQGYLEAPQPRGAPDTVSDALRQAASVLFARCCLQLPGARHVADEEAVDMVERVQSLVRIAVADASLVQPDRSLLIDRLGQLVQDPEGQPLIRGAGHGLLHALGVLPERAVAAALRGYLEGPVEQVSRGGAFLEGVLRVARSAFLSSARLLRAVHVTLGRLDEDAFRRVLPDLRRAFAVFIPAELETIGARVSAELLGEQQVDPDAPVPEDQQIRARRIDAEVQALLAPYLS